jgi:hypothetical protein
MSPRRRCRAAVLGAAIVLASIHALADVPLGVGFHAGQIESRSLRSSGADVGVTAEYRGVPWLRLGTYVDYVSVPIFGNNSVSEKGEAFDDVRFGGRAELHPLPRFVVDPWIATAFGAFHVPSVEYLGSAIRPYGNMTGVDLQIDGGVDFQLGSGVSIGLYYLWVDPLTSRAAFARPGTGSNAVFDTSLPLVMFRLAFGFSL